MIIAETIYKKDEYMLHTICPNCGARESTPASLNSICMFCSKTRMVLNRFGTLGCDEIIDIESPDGFIATFVRCGKSKSCNRCKEEEILRQKIKNGNML